ncbi:MAG: arginase [SAR324 cluster bacterium]|nr:arginase [SAR324 cluster bacterium]
MKSLIRILGIPIDLGQKKRGVDMGPGAIRYAGLSSRLQKLGYQVEDRGNIHVPVRESVREADLLETIHQACETVYQTARELATDDGSISIFLGGDHSTAIGTIGGLTHNAARGVIWVDAHGDFNTLDNSPSGNVHGMALSSLLGMGSKELVNIGRPGAKINPGDTVLIAIRELDPAEKTCLKQSGVKVYTMRDIDEQGMKMVAQSALKHLVHMPEIHVSLDMDSLDPSIAPGVGTPVPGGITYREAQLLMEMIADTERCRSLDIVEINPLIDHQNQTAKSAVDLAGSLFGQRII